MKKIYFSTMIACLLAFVGCQNEELVNETTDTGNGKKVTLTANIAGATDSRVAFNEISSDGELNVGDPVINVNWRNDSNDPEKFKVHGTGSEPVWTEFTQTQGNNFAGTLPEGADYAYYGYTISSGALSYDLSSQDGTLNENYILMQAPVNENSNSITFHHKTAILKVEFTCDNTSFNAANITEIVMDNVHAQSGSDYSSITITPAQASLGYFYIFLPIVNEGGYGVGYTFKFTVTADEKNYIGSLTIPEDMSIVAGKLYTAELSIIPYVTFRAASTQTLDLEQRITVELDENTDEYVSVHKPYPWDEDDNVYIEYSVGNSNVWTQFTPESLPVAFGGDKGDLHLRGKSPNGTLYARIVFGDNTIPVACSGDIRTLVDWENYATADNTRSAIFYGLFENCTVLRSAPELPATTLAPYCYQSMFWGCISLAVAPELPATTLANYCYANMFKGCTLLTSAPVLEAATLVDRCYNGMFTGCTSLNSITMLATNITATDCLAYWVYNVEESGTFTKAAGMEIPTGVSGIPSGWTVQE